MAYPVSIMIGVCVGGVFSNKHTKKSEKKLQNQILNIAKKTVLKNTLDDFKEYPNKISGILSGMKGDYMVMAGVYNTFGYETAEKIAITVSKKLNCETMVMAYDCTAQRIECMVYQSGKSKSNKPILGYDE